MNYYSIDPKDHRYDNYVFFESDDDIGLVVRTQYSHLRCPVCKRMDTAKALELPCPAGVRIRGRHDLQQTHDGVYYCNSRTRQVLDDNGVSGIRYVQIPDQSDYYLIVPTWKCPIDRSQPGFEFVPPQCSKCGRFTEVYRFSRLTAMTLPEDPLVVFTPEISRESGSFTIITLLISEQVMKILKAGRVSGISFSKLAQTWPD